MANIIVGTRVSVSVTFTNAAGALFDPTTVTLRLRSPSSVTTSYTYGVDAALMRDSVGAYHLDQGYLCTVAGELFVEWSSTFSGQEAVNQQRLVVSKLF